MRSENELSSSSGITNSLPSVLSSHKSLQSSLGSFSKLDESEMHWSRFYLHKIFSSLVFGYIFLLLIVSNTIFIALQSVTFVAYNYSWYLILLDQVYLGIYIMEIVLKIYVYRLSYFKSKWNIFDFVIVGSSIVTFMLPFFLFAGGFDPKVPLF